MLEIKFKQLLKFYILPLGRVAFALFCIRSIYLR